MTLRLLILACLAWIGGKYSYLIADSDEQYATYFYLMNAVGCLLAISAVRFASSGKTRIYAEGFMWMALGEVIDEIWYDPTYSSISDVAMIAVAIGWITLRLKKK